MGFIRNLAGRFSKRSFNWFQNSYFNYGAFVNDDNILKSSDTYNLMKLISDQVALTDFVVEDGTTGRDSKDPRALQALRILNCPNDYLTVFLNLRSC